MMTQTLKATDYIFPLREGGSLPAVFRAEDDQLYVMKFTGAGQGPKALIAEWLGGEIARLLALNVPRQVFLDLDPVVGRSEPDAEIQDLLRGSAGINLGMAFIPETVAYSPLATDQPDDETASRIVWLDAYLRNVDRTLRNVNMLVEQETLWLIDHGAGLYFHHGSWQDPQKEARKAFPMIRDHVLLKRATDLANADSWARRQLTPERLEALVAALPEAWLAHESAFADPEATRQAYLAFLQSRLAHSPTFVQEAEDVRQQL